MSSTTWILAAITATAAFPDIPAGHWAEKAVTEVAVQRHFMHGYPDKSFRGDKPFTRAQMALAFDPFIDELEILSKVTWEPLGAARPAFTDLPADAGVRKAVDRVANHYHLYDGIMTGSRFGGDQPVSRYEMASLIERLLLLGEAKHVVDAGVLSPHHFPFTDVPGTPYPRDLVQDVADKYQVMVGFPNQTFRGLEKLTRYQFAAAAAQTFPLVKQLVIKTQEKLNPPSPKPTAKPTPRPTPAPAARFLEGTPVQVGPQSRVNNVVGIGAQTRFLGYHDNWFWLLQTRLGVPLCTSEIAYDGDLVGGYAFQLTPTLALQPYLGGRLVDVNPSLGYAGTYGAILYHRPVPQWGWYAQAHGATSAVAAQGLPVGATWFGGALGLEYKWTPGFGTYAEAGWAQWPRTLNAPAGTPFDVDAAITGSVGVSFGL
ncbi:MAG: hypothetical protein JWM80_1679 [Cyanobacteria bacterium RYN_339]|nr:hypothetical protein [Cyanobacteria bacterium RYN_339]